MAAPEMVIFAEMRRITRARYHRAIILIDGHAKTIKVNTMADDNIVSNRSRYLWRKSDKLRYNAI